MKVRQVYGGYWYKASLPGFFMHCCDCGLVHHIRFKFGPKLRIMVQFYREKSNG